MVFFNTIEELDANKEYNNIVVELYAKIVKNLVCISEFFEPNLIVDIEFNPDAKCVRTWLNEIHQTMNLIKDHCSDSVLQQLQWEMELLIKIKYNIESPIILMIGGKCIVKFLLSNNHYDDSELDKFDMDNEILDNNIEIIKNNCCYTNEFIIKIINEWINDN